MNAPHPVASRAEWLAQRRALLVREKAQMRREDELARARRALPWVRVDAPYRFDTPDGPCSLADLFDGQRQLVVQHIMFGPGWDAGCPSCAYMADHVDGMRPHLAARGIAFVAVSRAPLAEIARFQARMGWRFRWVSSFGSDFNRDLGVSFDPAEVARGRVHYNYTDQAFPQQEAPGIGVFARDDDGQVFHTYATYGRGVEVLMGAYRVMDLTPLGRQEPDVPHKMAWVRHHDRYTAADRPGQDASLAQAPPAPMFDEAAGQ